MLEVARKKLSEDRAWANAARLRIAEAQTRLDGAFKALAEGR
jgi:hypothetical protein